VSSPPSPSEQASPSVVPVRPAGTLVLVRDGERGPEVLLLERARDLAFVAGAAVFPGGSVDPADVRVAETLGARDGWWGKGSARVPELGAAVAAVRECAEEAGIFLVRIAGGAEPASRGRVGEPERATWRRLAEKGPTLLWSTLALAGFEPDVGSLVPFARWVTPEGLPRRFDTWFFAALAPEGQEAVPDHSEVLRAMWVRPEDALGASRSGSLDLVLPTRTVLARSLSGHADAASLLEALRGSGTPEAVRPRLVRSAEGVRFAPPFEDEPAPR